MSPTKCPKGYVVSEVNSELEQAKGPEPHMLKNKKC
jgi:hypothetical protein